ncbi:unnamed protein product, partial [Choristocarpus tenellus]
MSGSWLVGGINAGNERVQQLSQQQDPQCILREGSPQVSASRGPGNPPINLNSKRSEEIMGAPQEDLIPPDDKEDEDFLTYIFSRENFDDSIEGPLEGESGSPRSQLFLTDQFGGISASDQRSFSLQGQQMHKTLPLFLHQSAEQQTCGG